MNVETEHQLKIDLEIDEVLWKLQKVWIPFGGWQYHHTAVCVEHIGIHNEETSFWFKKYDSTRKAKTENVIKMLTSDNLIPMLEGYSVEGRCEFLNVLILAACSL